MAGNIGSPLCAELNRIANNGVYPDRDDFLEEQGAANVWAGTSGQGLLGALNYIVDPNRTENNFSDLTKVCNELAGTTGLSDVDALRTIGHAAEVLLRGTTPQSAAFYTDAATPRYNYPGYVRLNGVDGNYISTPDATALDITGDVDLRIRVALDDWTPSTSQTLLSKLNTSQFSYQIILNTSGTVSFRWSANGTTLLTSTSSVAPTVADGATLWVRATMDVDNGASGNTVTFFTSNNGTTWTQLGTTITTAGVTSIFNGTASVEIGSHFAGSNVLTGNVYQAQIFAGLTGTDKRFDADLTTNVTSATYDQFTATTGQLCTINGQNILTNAGNAGSLLPITVGSSLAADSNDPKFLDFAGVNYVYAPGIDGNNMTILDTAALDITGDLDIRVLIAADDWTPATISELITKYATSTNDRSYRLALNTAGNIVLYWSTDGTSATVINSGNGIGSNAIPVVTDGQPLWIRATLDVNNNASGNDVKFFTSADGTTWTQLGTTITTAGVTSIYAGNANVEIGTRPGGGTSAFPGKVYRAQILNGIGGTTVLDVDTSVITTGAATSFTAVTGQTVTINRSTSGRKTVAVTQPTWLFGTDDFMEVNNRWLERTTANYLYLPGVASNNASAPDSAALDIVGDIDIRVKAALDSWTPPASPNYLTAKIQTFGNQVSYGLRVDSDGRVRLLWSENGSTFIEKASTVANGLTNGATKWVRATLDVDNGASGNDVQFFTSDDGTNWTQLGTTVTTAGVTSIFNSTTPLEIGSNIGGTSFPARGKFFRAQVLNGIGGTVAFDANFETGITSLNQASFTESSSNAATVTINRSGSTFRSAGVIDAGYLYPGATNTFSNSAIDYLNFGATDPMTMLFIGRLWSTQNGFRYHMSKNVAYGFSNDGTNLSTRSVINGTQLNTSYLSTNGSLVALATVINRDNSTSTYFANASQVGPSAAFSSAMTNFSTFKFGRNDEALYQDFELVGAAVFRSALTATQISRLNDYFQNRY